MENKNSLKEDEIFKIQSGLSNLLKPVDISYSDVSYLAHNILGILNIAGVSNFMYGVFCRELNPDDLISALVCSSLTCLFGVGDLVHTYVKVKNRQDKNSEIQKLANNYYSGSAKKVLNKVPKVKEYALSLIKEGKYQALFDNLNVAEKMYDFIRNDVSNVFIGTKIFDNKFAVLEDIIAYNQENDNALNSIEKCNKFFKRRDYIFLHPQSSQR